MHKKTKAPAATKKAATVVGDGPTEEVTRPTPKASPTLDFARSRFDELAKAKEAAVKKYQKYRDHYEAAVNDAALIEARTKIKEFNGIVGPIDTELAQLSKVLGTTALSTGPAAQE